MSTAPHLDDDRLSALLDGEADPDEVQHADTCANCGARLAAWRDTSRLVAANPPVAPEARRQAAVDAAIAAATADESSGRGPIPMATRRRRTAFAVPRIAAAAAAVIVVAGIGVAVSQSGGGGSGQASTAAKAATKPPAASTTPPAASTTQPSGSNASAAAGPSASGHVELGSYQDQAHLVAALRAQLTNPAPNAPSTLSLPAAATSQQCLGRARTDAKLSAPADPVLQATLDYRGSPAQVFVYTQAGRHVAVVVGVPKCALLADITF